jgi:hypothetical protein
MIEKKYLDTNLILFLLLRQLNHFNILKIRGDQFYCFDPGDLCFDIQWSERLNSFNFFLINLKSGLLYLWCGVVVVKEKKYG